MLDSIVKSIDIMSIANFLRATYRTNLTSATEAEIQDTVDFVLESKSLDDYHVLFVKHATKFLKKIVITYDPTLIPYYNQIDADGRLDLLLERMYCYSMQSIKRMEMQSFDGDYSDILDNGLANNYEKQVRLVSHFHNDAGLAAFQIGKRSLNVKKFLEEAYINLSNSVAFSLCLSNPSPRDYFFAAHALSNQLDSAITLYELLTNTTKKIKFLEQVFDKDNVWNNALIVDELGLVDSSLIWKQISYLMTEYFNITGQKKLRLAELKYYANCNATRIIELFRQNDIIQVAQYSLYSAESASKLVSFKRQESEKVFWAKRAVAWYTKFIEMRPDTQDATMKSQVLTVENRLNNLMNLYNLPRTIML